LEESRFEVKPMIAHAEIFGNAQSVV